MITALARFVHVQESVWGLGAGTLSADPLVAPLVPGVAAGELEPRGVRAQGEYLLLHGFTLLTTG